MPQISQNFMNRVRKLPKPSNSAQALQPVFEAISNGQFAIEDLNSSIANGVSENRGTVLVRVENLKDPDSISIEVSDDGIGLDDERFSAFCEMDTEYKRDKGGKGVGRLFWLDAFSEVAASSSYMSSGDLKRRDFGFFLTNDEQIIQTESGLRGSERGTTIRFSKLRGTAYRTNFPKRSDTFLRYFSSHFIADFLIGSGPKVIVDIDGNLTVYPSAISDLVVGRETRITTPEHEEFGVLEIVGFNCRADASKGLDGFHQLHLLADKRTVLTREIDKLLGIKRVEVDAETDLVFHGCVSGEYLNQHVNEGRTAFVLEEKKAR